MASKNSGMAEPAAPDNYQAEDDVRTLQRAIEIHGDKKRHRAARKMAGQKAADLHKISKFRGLLAPGDSLDVTKPVKDMIGSD